MTREGLSQGWWRSPRWLGDELIDGRLTLVESALVSLVGSRREADPEGEGYATTLDFLRGVFGVSDSTIRRAVKRTCAADLLVSDLRQGQRTPFRLWIGPRLRSRLRSETGVSVTEVTSVSREEPDGPDAAPGAAFPDARLRSSRARASETETETETTDWRAVGREAASAPAEDGDEETDFILFDEDVFDDEADTAVEVLIQLIHDLGDGDVKTGTTLRRQASGLSARDIAYVTEQVRKREHYVQSPGAYAVGVIQSIKGGYSGP